MMNNGANLSTLAGRTAERFIKSVVVIDNEIFSHGNGNTGHSLDGLTLTKAFAEKGIACAIFNPEEESTELVSTCTQLITQSDASVLDWQLRKKNGDPSMDCRQILKVILEKDKDAGAPLRVILIYTGEDDLSVLIDQLHAELKHLELEEIRGEGKLPGLAGRNVRIVFATKRNPGEESGEFTPADRLLPAQLPDALIEQFSYLADGILPMTALNAIAALREHSHTLLSFFDKELDAAFVHHAAIIPDSRDCTAFLLELLRDELLTVMESDDSIRNCTNFKTLRSWYSQKLCFKDLNGKTLKQENFEELIVPEYAPDKCCTTVLKDERNTVVSKSKLHRIYQDTEKLCRLSRITAVRREAYGRHRTILERYEPIVTQGTIIQCQQCKRCFLCIIPSCDSCRLKDNVAVFPFIRLEPCASNQDPHLCCGLNGATMNFLLPEPLEWKSIELIKLFTENGGVKAQRKDGSFIFRSQDGCVYNWVADLKDHFITMLVAEFAPNLSRIGIDEYEWLRRNRQTRQSKSK